MKLKIKKLVFSIIASSSICTMFVSLFKLNENVEELSETVGELTKEVNMIKEECADIQTELDMIEQKMEELNKQKENSSVQQLSKNDTFILEYFDTTLRDVINTSERENIGIYRESIVQAVSYLSDFIFFDYDLLGIKFTDITTDTKASAIITYVEIDKRVEQMYPGYKDELGDKYDTIKQFFENLYEYNKKEYVVNYIESKDDDSYNAKDKVNVKK